MSEIKLSQVNMSEADELRELKEKLENLQSKYDNQNENFNKLLRRVSIIDNLSETYDGEKPKDNEEIREEQIRMGLLEMEIKNLKKWMRVTTWTGPGIVFRTKSVLHKIFWVFLFLLFMAATIYVLVITVLAYQQYSEVTSVINVPDVPAQFPTITICNLNPFFITELTDSATFSQLNNYNSYTSSYSFNGSSNDLSNTPEFLRLQKLLASVKYKEFIRMYKESQKSLGDAGLIKSFQQKILGCYFANNLCNFQKDFNVYYNTDNLFCFKFNSDTSNVKLVRKAGFTNGFQLSVYLGDTNTEAITNRRGLRVFIHNNTETYPINFIDIQPGVVTNIGIKRSFYQRLPDPYSNCVQDPSSLPSERQNDVIRYMFGVLKTSYTYALCENLVFTFGLRQACGCIDKSYVISDLPQLCQTVAQYDCMNSFRVTNNIDPIASCPKECFSIDYNKEISYSQPITDWYVDYIKKSIQPYLNNINDPKLNPQISLLNTAFQQNANAQSIRSNIVTFNVYYNELNYNFINGVAQTNWFGLLANLAGICGGSFLGISLLSIAEFFEYIYFAFYILLKYAYYRLNIDKKVSKLKITDKFNNLKTKVMNRKKK